MKVEEGIEIQKRHLADWKKLLKKSVYLDLVAEAEKQNLTVKTGYDVFRGNSITNFIENYLYNKKKTEYRIYMEGFKSISTTSKESFENKKKYLDNIGIPYQTDIVCE